MFDAKDKRDLVFNCKVLILCNIGCALASKFFGEARTHEISKTQKSFGEIQSGLCFIKIINVFNGVSKSKLRKIKNINEY